MQRKQFKTGVFQLKVTNAPAKDLAAYNKLATKKANGTPSYIRGVLPEG